MLKKTRLHIHRLGAKLKEMPGGEKSDRLKGSLSFWTGILPRILSAERSSIFITNPENDTIWLKAGTGLKDHDIEVPRQGSIVGQVVERCETVRLENLQEREGAHRETDRQTGFTTRSVLCVPIIDPELGEAVGAVQVLNKLGENAFTDEDQQLLEDVAAQIQIRASQIYLDQEIYGLSESLLKITVRLLGTVFVVTSIAAVAGLLLMMLWLAAPSLN